MAREAIVRMCRAWWEAGLPLLATLFLTGACREGAPPRPGVEVDTVGGVERLTYSAGGIRRLDWDVDTLTVLGGVGVDNPVFQFGGVGPEGLAADSAGNLYVLDADGIRVLGYRPDGTFMGSFGREGSGPGELGSSFAGGPRTMAMGPGDTLWIADPRNRRFTLLPVRGGKPASIPFPDPSISIEGRMDVDSTGALALSSGSSFLSEVPEEAPSRPLVRYNRRGGIDTVWTFPPKVFDTARIDLGSFAPIMRWPQVFSPGLSWVLFADGGFAIQESADYEIQLVDPAGEVDRIVRRSPAPRPTTEADRQAYLDSLLAPSNSATSDPIEARRQRAQATTFAVVIPRIVDMLRDTSGRLWVGVSEATPDRIERIDVYDRYGALLGELRDIPMPDFFFGDGLAVILDADELDVQRATIVHIVE